MGEIECETERGSVRETGSVADLRDTVQEELLSSSPDPAALVAAATFSGRSSSRARQLQFVLQ
jgi:hypothetical protein